MPTQKIELRLYIAGDSPRSRIALSSLARLETMAEGYSLEVVDVLDQPGRAEEDRILATPTLLRVSPAPQRRIVGDLGSLPRLLHALGTPLDGDGDGDGPDGDGHAGGHADGRSDGRSHGRADGRSHGGADRDSEGWMLEG